MKCTIALSKEIEDAGIVEDSKDAGIASNSHNLDNTQMSLIIAINEMLDMYGTDVIFICTWMCIYSISDEFQGQGHRSNVL